MNDNLSSMITPKNLVKNNLFRVMSLGSKGVVVLDYIIRARWKIIKFDFYIFNVASQTVNFESSVLGKTKKSFAYVVPCLYFSLYDILY